MLRKSTDFENKVCQVAKRKRAHPEGWTREGGDMRGVRRQASGVARLRSDDRPAPGFQHCDRQQRGQDVGSGSDPEHLVPVAARLLHVVCDRHQQRRRALGGVEEARIGGRELRTEGVGASRGEEGIEDGRRRGKGRGKSKR